LVAYEFLWRSQSQYRDDGFKVYPAAVVFARGTGDGAITTYALGMSHSQPSALQRAVEVPRKLKRHLGLDELPSWIYTDQLNVFVWAGADLRPASWLSEKPHLDSCVIGALPTGWFHDLLQHLDESRRLQKLKVIKRT
jgi:hypothetical protein